MDTCAVATGASMSDELRLLKEMIITEVDLGYDKRQNTATDDSICNTTYTWKFISDFI